MNDRSKKRSLNFCKWTSIFFLSLAISHYLQFVKNGKSSCKSDLKKNNGKYDKELAKEHKQFSKEIYGMIKNSEYGELERKWREINKFLIILFLN